MKRDWTKILHDFCVSCGYLVPIKDLKEDICVKCIKKGSVK